MKPRHLFKSVLLGALVLIGFNILVRYQAVHLPPQQLLLRINTEGPQVRWAFLGDSQMAAGVDAAAFSEQCAPGTVAMNVALGATYASEHFLVLEYLLSRAPLLHTVVYGFFDSRLTDAVPHGWRDLVGNRALVYLFPEKSVPLLGLKQDAESWEVRWTAHVPMMAERLGIWAKVERFRRTIASLGLPRETTSRFGRARDFTAIEPTAPKDFENTLQTAVTTDRSLNLPVQQILQNCASRNLKTYVIVMPVPSRHRARFYSTAAWLRYRAYAAHKIEESGGVLVDASAWIPDEGFADALHLKPEGAVVFGADLARVLCPAAAR